MLVDQSPETSPLNSLALMKVFVNGIIEFLGGIEDANILHSQLFLCGILWPSL